MKRSPFDILGVLPCADDVVIDAAYRAMARKYHPDLNPDVAPEELNRRMTSLTGQGKNCNGTLRGGESALQAG